MDWLMQFAQEFVKQFLRVLAYPLESTQRIFVLYLVAALLIAVGIYITSAQRREDARNGQSFTQGAIHFLFPGHVWSHPSAWVDVRYFLPHQMLRLWIYTHFLPSIVFLSQGWVLSLLQALGGRTSIFTMPADHIYLMLSIGIVSLLAIDFTAFYMHYLQHKKPFLWAFHKVHHSAEVLQPLSNYREHPVDNVAYALVMGTTVGTISGIFHFLFGSIPLEIVLPVLGISVSTFAFNFFGYNLRHSHIWLRWPGKLSLIFGSPAHHQIHHSFKSEHLNKNFAFMFPVWDILFGTFYLPEQKEEMEFGLGDGTEKNYNSFISIYTLPFATLFKR